jgi:hypothetical protein
LLNKILLTKTDGIFDVGDIEIKSDTIYTVVNHYDGTYWDDYENSNQVDSIPDCVEKKKYFLDLSGCKLNRVE